MIGVSLPVYLFEEENRTELDEIIRYLKAEGVASVELRALRTDHDPGVVRTMMDLLWAEGFSLTVHGSVKSEESCVSDIFAPLSQAFPLRQSRLNITFHPIVGDNAAVLCALSDQAAKLSLPVCFSLENNRLMPDNTEGDSVGLVLDAVKRAARDNVGICFDMGHYAYVVKKHFPDAPDTLPPEEFWRHVTHTHIHAIKGYSTHYPLEGFELPLQGILEKLSCGYYGVYNFEPDFPRVQKEFTPMEALRKSVPFLKNALTPSAWLYDRVRREFDRDFARALTVQEKTDGTFMSLVQSASYLFSTNGYFWGMDLAFRGCYDLAETPYRAAELLRGLKLMIITHEHEDHFEERTVRALSQNDTLWLIPACLEEMALQRGLPREKLILARAGETVQVGPLTILPFESRHFRPDGRGVPEYGYYITAEGQPSLAFPADVRRYVKPDFPFDQADVCFSHVWFCDDNRSPELQDGAEAFADYALAASRKKILLAHLYETGREDNVMWRREHAELAKVRILEKSPETEVLIPDWGEVIEL